jgi:hypothetical protein
MGKEFADLNDDLRQFIARQHVFFVATAPLGADKHVNLSPKGLDTFRVLGPTTVAYLDLTGSGVETIAHLRENGRLTIMFCAFEGRPRILRLYGRGRVIEPGDADWPAVADEFPTMSGTRSVIVLEVDRIADSCGYAVPRYEYVGDRPQLNEWCEKKGPEGVREYQARKNRVSIDGLPGLRSVGTVEPTGFRLVHVPGMFAVCKLASDAPLPSWATAGGLFSVTRTADELSIVCPQAVAPVGVHCESGWRCLRVAGAMPFTLVGVLAALTTAVARAGVGVFAVSTFDTDYLFIKAADLPRAVAGLRTAGHIVETEEGT